MKYDDSTSVKSLILFIQCREKLLALTTTPHSFWCLRNRFMTSYTAMSICSWILGIGDRHLENILVCLKTGTCVGRFRFSCRFSFYLFMYTFFFEIRIVVVLNVYTILKGFNNALNSSFLIIKFKCT